MKKEYVIVTWYYYTFDFIELPIHMDMSSLSASLLAAPVKLRPSKETLGIDMPTTRRHARTQ